MVNVAKYCGETVYRNERSDTEFLETCYGNGLHRYRKAVSDFNSSGVSKIKKIVFEDRSESFYPKLKG